MPVAFVRESRQLLDQIDPARFHEKDLDAVAERYLADAVYEIGPARPLRLVVHLPPAEATYDNARTLPEAIAHCFDYRAKQTQADLRRLRGRGATSLAIGRIVLAACLSLRTSLPQTAAFTLLSEGLLIIGWVG